MQRQPPNFDPDNFSDKHSVLIVARFFLSPPRVTGLGLSDAAPQQTGDPLPGSPDPALPVHPAPGECGEGAGNCHRPARLQIQARAALVACVGALLRWRRSRVRRPPCPASVARLICVVAVIVVGLVTTRRTVSTITTTTRCLRTCTAMRCLAPRQPVVS
jgi:hypothetical protein